MSIEGGIVLEVALDLSFDRLLMMMMMMMMICINYRYKFSEFRKKPKQRQPPLQTLLSPAITSPCIQHSVWSPKVYIDRCFIMFNGSHIFHTYVVRFSKKAESDLKGRVCLKHPLSCDLSLCFRLSPLGTYYLTILPNVF